MTSHGSREHASQPAAGTRGFEYLDHTADVQIHAWGSDLAEAFEEAAVGMFNYISPLDKVAAEQQVTFETVSGHDLQSLLYAFLDEALFQFNGGDYFLCKRVAISALRSGPDEFSVSASARGEPFDREKHESGTEVKAITYSNMQIFLPSAERPCAEVFVIVDI